MNKILPLFFTLFIFTITNGQISFKVEDDLSYPDFRVKIGDDVSYPDIRIKIGNDISYEDFTVGITENKSKADYIISESNYADFKIKAGDDVSYPDLRIKAGDDVSYPDLRIEIKKTGTVNYLVYTEKDFISKTDLIIALLPAIHKYTEYKNEKLGEILMKNSSYSNNMSCTELFGFIEKNGYEESSLSSYTLDSSWLKEVKAYSYNGEIYVIAEIKKDEYSYKTNSYVFCEISSYDWSNFKNGGYGDSESYGKRFHKYIFENKCDCK